MQETGADDTVAGLGKEEGNEVKKVALLRRVQRADALVGDDKSDSVGQASRGKRCSIFARWRSPSARCSAS